jgi:hypothetical protein
MAATLAGRSIAPQRLKQLDERVVPPGHHVGEHRRQAPKPNSSWNRSPDCRRDAGVIPRSPSSRISRQLGSQPPEQRKADIALAQRLAHEPGTLFEVAERYSPSRIADAVAHVSQAGRTGVVLIDFSKD